MVDPFKLRKKRRPDIIPIPAPPLEELSGIVQGKDATDIEERTAIALAFYKVPHVFRYQLFTISTFGGKRKEVDFRVEFDGQYHPLEIDGTIGHSTPAQLAEDRLREDEIKPELMAMGWNPQFIRFLERELLTQELAYDRVRIMLGG